MSSWLPPSLIGATSAALLVGLLYCYLYWQNRERCLLFWGVSWLVYALRFPVQLLIVTASAPAGLIALQQLFSIVGAALFVLGAYQFVDRALPRLWLMVFNLCILWSFFFDSSRSFFWYNLPTDLVVGATYFWMGLLLFRTEKNKSVGLCVASWSLMLWGMHKADYAFLRPLTWFAPWGFLLATLLFLAVSIGIILLYFEKMHAQLQAENESRRRVEGALRLQNRRVEALLKLYHMADASLKEVTDYAMEEAVKLTGSTVGYLAFLNEDETVLTMHSWSRDAMSQCAMDDKPIIYPVAKTGLWGEAVRQRQPVITNDYAAPNPLKKGCPQGHVHLIRHANVPIFRSDRIVLVGGVANKAGDYDESDIQQMTLLLEGMWQHIERQNVYTALRESEKRQRMLMDNIGVGVVIVDADSKKIEYVNPAAAQLYGHAMDDLMGRAVHDILHPAWSGGDATDSGHDIDNADSSLLKVDGTAIPILRSMKRVRFSGGDKLIETFVDITERKQLEADRMAMEDRLQRAEKMEALGTLAGGVAHDLNNVLGVLVGYSELMLKRISEESPIKRYAENILQGSERAAAIIQDLLTMARRAVTVSQTMNLNRLITDFMSNPQMTSLKVKHRLVLIRTDLAPDLCNMRGSTIHIEKVLINLVSNALEAISDSGEVVIHTENRHLDQSIHGYECTREGEYVVLSVSDTGEGIGAHDLRRIFEPFYTKKTMGKSGTGLGLSIVWGTVKDHHGYIDVKSKLGEGTTFDLYFPATSDSVEEAKPHSQLSAFMGKGELIMVVDDVKEQREMASQMLEQLNYRVICAASGEEAVDYLETHSVDLLVLDMIMEPGSMVLKRIAGSRPRILIRKRLS